MIKLSIKTGFTLIELIVIISIIVFISISGVALVNRKIKTARIERANADLKQIEKAIEVKRIEENKVLGQITGNFCSDCSCRIAPGTNWGYSKESIHRPSCISALTASFKKIGFTYLPYDPWGNPYLIDENELESGRCPYVDEPSVRDYVLSFSYRATPVYTYQCKK